MWLLMVETEKARAFGMPFIFPTSLYRTLFFLNFAHLARCAAAIRSRAAAESVRLPLPPEFLVLPLNAAIARFSLSRSFFNVASTAPRSVIESTRWDGLNSIRR